MTVETTSLRDMCQFVIDCPHFTPDWTSSGFIVVRNQNIRHGRLDLSNPSFTHRVDFERRNRRAKPQAGDIIFTREAPMGEVCLVPDGLECCIGQRQVLLRPADSVDGKYLFYALQSAYVRHQIFWNEGTGSTVSNVRIPVLEALKIPRLGRSEASIGNLLSALDEKIDLNRRMNETLEAMARAIFKDWFVDFGPTRAKMEGRPPYLAPDLWALFPDRLDEEGKPEGWEAGTLGDVAQSQVRTCQPNEIAAGTSYIALEHMPRRSIALDQWASADKVESNKLRFRQGEFLFGKLRPYFHKVGIAPVDGVCTTDAVVIGPKSSEWASAVLMLLSSDEFVAFTNQGSTGTKMPRTSWREMARFPLTRPTKPLVARALDHLVNPMTDRIVGNVHEIKTLAATRDLLLPKLMSGEMRVCEAENLLGAVA